MQKTHRLTSFFTALAYCFESKKPCGFLPSFYYPQSAQQFSEIMRFVAQDALEDSFIKNVSDMYIEDSGLEYGSARLEIDEAFDSIEEGNLAYSKLTPEGKAIGEPVYTAHRTCFNKIGRVIWKMAQDPSHCEKFGIVFVQK
jgi:hypothetical protein